jgi:opacity protein-like surface antigen
MFAGSAFAQTPPSSWTGFYFGGGLSYERAKISAGHATFTTQQSSSSPAVSGSFTPQTSEHQFNGQIFAGYRAQLNSFVGGLEANLNLDSTKKFAPLAAPVCSSSNACVGAAPFGTLRDYGRIRAMAGYLVSPNLLAFLSAGAAFGQGNPFGFGIGASVDRGTTYWTNRYFFRNTQKNVVGWTLGGGLEGKINDHLSVRAEYIYDRFPSISTPPFSASISMNPGSGSTAEVSANNGKATFSQQSTMISLVYSY